MKFILATLLTFSSLHATAANSGLKCTMSYSSTDVLSSALDSTGGWLIDGQRMAGSAVGVDKDGTWSTKPANSISVSKKGNFWNVEIFDGTKTAIGSFSFSEKQGMKATISTKAFMANESEDPPAYDKLEVSCYYSVFAG